MRCCLCWRRELRITAFDIASRYLGTRELPGRLDNPHILAWLMDAGVGDPRQASALYHDEVPWCGAFVGHIVRLCGLSIPQLPARARSWLRAGMPIEVKEARVGWDLIVLQRGDGLQPDAMTLDAPGHVGFFSGWDVEAGAPFEPKAVRVLGGNQSNSVSVAGFPLARILGVRRLLLGTA